MKVHAISFKGEKERVQLSNTPQSIEDNKNLLEKIAKKNKVELSIKRAFENKYLPTSDAYIVLATRKKPFKNGISCVIADKKEDGKSLVEKILDATKKAISQTKKKPGKITTFFKKVINLFKKK